MNNPLEGDDQATQVKDEEVDPVLAKDGKAEEAAEETQDQKGALNDIPHFRLLKRTATQRKTRSTRVPWPIPSIPRRTLQAMTTRRRQRLSCCRRRRRPHLRTVRLVLVSLVQARLRLSFLSFVPPSGLLSTSRTVSGCTHRRSVHGPASLPSCHLSPAASHPARLYSRSALGLTTSRLGSPSPRRG